MERKDTNIVVDLDKTNKDCLDKKLLGNLDDIFDEVIANSRSLAKQLKIAESYCINGQFDKAISIYNALIKNNIVCVPAYIGIIKALSHNYTVYYGEYNEDSEYEDDECMDENNKDSIDNAIDNFRIIAGSLYSDTWDIGLSEYLIKRELNNKSYGECKIENKKVIGVRVLGENGHLTIPYGIKEISAKAFLNCKGLRSITIPTSVTSIEDNPFKSVQSINVEQGNPIYHSKGNCLIETQSKTLISGCSTSIIPDDGSVEMIGDYAFSECKDLTSITIPTSVKDIGFFAFSGCNNLSIIIPKSVTNIEDNPFESVQSINVEQGNPIYHSKGNCLIETQSKTLISGCSTSIIPDDGSVEIIGDYAFSECKDLTSITIPTSVKGIGCFAFSGCNNLSIIIPKSVTSIEVNPFESVQSINVEQGNPIYHSKGNCLIETQSKTLISGCSTSIIPDDGSVEIIGDYAFSECKDLTSITIPTSVKGIGFFAFSGCNNLSIIIPKSVTSIEDNPFESVQSINVEQGNPIYHSKGNCLIETQSKTLISGCSTSIIPDDGSVEIIGDYAFSECKDLTSITIPTSVKGIGCFAFSGCNNLSIIIPKSVTSIEVNPFESVQSINVEQGNPIYHSKGNCLIETQSKTLISGCSTSIIPDDGSVEIIGDYAFSECKDLTKITIPRSVRVIGSFCFDCCESLRIINYQGSESEWNQLLKDNNFELDEEVKKQCQIRFTNQ